MTFEAMEKEMAEMKLYLTNPEEYLKNCKDMEILRTLAIKNYKLNKQLKKLLELQEPVSS